MVMICISLFLEQATPTKSGEVIKVALEGVSNNTMLFSPTTPRSYNIQVGTLLTFPWPSHWG